MTFQELLQSAFNAGVSHGQSFSGGTIDEMFHSDEPDFYMWLTENQYELDSVISDIKDVSFQNGIDAANSSY